MGKLSQVMWPILGALASFSLSAQTILVSDVDDTIKVSYVLDRDSTVANLPMLNNAFIGMPELYHAISNLDDLKTIKYLSNAPRRSVGKIHEKFLRANNFPEGELVARSFWDLKTGNKHKISSIRKFISDYHPKNLILIGDNGEADAIVYATITTEYSDILALTYIRQAYSSKGWNKKFSKPLQKNQIPFSTSLDIALDLFDKKIISIEVLTDLVTKISPMILNESNLEERGKQMAFPEWYDCRDYELPELPILLDQEANNLLISYGLKVQQRCAQPPFGN